MSLKQLYDALNGMENGAELTKLLNTEINTLRNESAEWRTKYSGIAERLGVKGSTNVDDALAGIKSTLDALALTGGKPDEIGRQLAQLTEQVKTLTDKAASEEARAKTEREKRIGETKLNKAITALTNGKAANPAEIAKILMANIQTKDEGSDELIFKNGDQVVSIEEGVTKYLESNPWAVANTQKPGAGSAGDLGGGTTDLESMTPEEYKAYYLKREGLVK